jgi:hypothetical protein
MGLSQSFILRVEGHILRVEGQVSQLAKIVMSATN